jgi:hypothetical protein
MPCRIEEFIQAIWSDLISWAGHKAFYYFALPLINVSCTAVLHNTRKTRLQRRMHAKWIRRRDNRACKMDPRSAICIFSPPMQSAFDLYVFLDFQPASLSLSLSPRIHPASLSSAPPPTEWSFGDVLWVVRRPRACTRSCRRSTELTEEAFLVVLAAGLPGRGKEMLREEWAKVPAFFLTASQKLLRYVWIDFTLDASEDEEGWRSTIQMDDPNALAALEITQCKWVMYFPPSMQSAKCITSLDTPGWAQPWINCYIVQFCTSLSHYIRAQMSWFTNC